MVAPHPPTQNQPHIGSIMMGHSLNIIHRCLNPLEPFIYICKEAQCMILYIGEELPITTYSNHRCLWSGALSYDKNRLCDWEASAKFGFHGKVWVFAWRWAIDIIHNCKVYVKEYIYIKMFYSRCWELRIHQLSKIFWSITLAMLSLTMGYYGIF